MPAASTDLFRKGTNNFSTTLGSGIGSSDTTISLASTTNLPTDTGIDLVIDRVDSNGNKTPALREYVKGVISGTTLITVQRGQGNSTAQTHSIGAVVEFVFDQGTLNDMVTGMTNQHLQDGTHGNVTAISINTTSPSQLKDNSTALSTYRSDYTFDFVASGGVWSGDSYGGSLNGSMTAIVCYINGQRLSIGAVTAHIFGASQDTYIDILNTAGVGSIVYTPVANNAASPALAANSLRIGIVVSGANIAAATSVNQGQETMILPIASSIPYAVTDSLGNLICPRDPNRKILGLRQITSTFTDNSGTVTQKQITGLSVPVIVPANRKIRITGFSEDIGTNSGNATTLFTIWDGVVTSGTQIGASRRTTTSASGLSGSNYVTAVVTPTATSKTFNLGLSADNAATPPFIEASATAPAYILIELS